VEIIGYPPPHEELPGHDLNYQARAGLVTPPNMPATCIADLAGAQDVMSAALGLLLARERGQGAGHARVSLAESAREFAEPLRHGLTTAAGPLGGSFAGYNLYSCRAGWVAVAALESHFFRRLGELLKLPEPSRQQLQTAFSQRTAIEWEAWAERNDLPVIAVREPELYESVAAPNLREELLSLAAADHAARAELADDGALFEGYHPHMAAVHKRNAARLSEIIDAHGWPDRALVGEDGAHAAWLILQHAINTPMLQRRGLQLLRQAAAARQIPAWQPAFLEDRIRVLEGRPQLFGSQFDWDEDGLMSPCPIEDVAAVDARRSDVGLEPLDEAIRTHRARASKGPEKPPHDWARRQREMDEWARATGWRD
jgi:hypothetical protein